MYVVGSDLVCAAMFLLFGGYGIYQAGYFIGWASRNKVGFDEVQTSFQGGMSARDKLIESLTKSRNELLAIVEGRAPKKDAQPS